MWYVSLMYNKRGVDWCLAATLRYDVLTLYVVTAAEGGLFVFRYPESKSTYYDSETCHVKHSVCI